MLLRTTPSSPHLPPLETFRTVFFQGKWCRCKSPAAAAKSLQSCLTLCDPIDSSPSGSSVPGILQERILEWVAISFSSD